MDKINPAWETLEDFLVEGDMKYFDKYKKESGFDEKYNTKIKEEGPTQ